MITTMRVHRSLSAGATPIRRLCTATVAAAEAEAEGEGVLQPQTTTEVPLYRRLVVLPMTGDTVEQTLNEYIREGRVIKKEQLEGSIKSLRNRRRYRHALEIMEWMVARKVNFSYRDIAVHLDLLAKARGIDAAEKYFNDLESHVKNKFTYGTLLNCYCQEKMEEEALSLFQKMEEIGVTSTLAFNNLMSLYMKLEQPEKVPGLVKEMRERNFPMQTFTYNVLMHSYGCMGDIEGMERVYEELVAENDDKCDWTTYSNLAIEYTKAGLHEKAESALKKLEEKMGPRERDRPAYHFLISLYTKISNLDEVHRIWKLLRSDFPRMINLDYIIILQALERLNDIDGFKKLYSEWESTFTNFDTRVTNIAIKFYLGREMITEGEYVLHEAIKKSKGPFFRSWELFIEFFLMKQNMGDALKCLEAATFKAKDNGWKPKPEYIEKLLEHFEVEGDVNGVKKLFTMLKRINCLDTGVYLSLFRTCIATGKTMDEMKEKLESDGIEINSELEKLLQSACLK